MYQFSRSLYRELGTLVSADRSTSLCQNRQLFLQSCEAAFKRLASDRHYFARPSRSLFNEVRTLFPMAAQLRVYRVIDRHMEIATQYVDQRERQGISLDGSPLCCHASTRKGTACQRVPLPGSKYCPSHKHLEEDFARSAA
ncbi:MAG: hypothetical protein NVSMB25_04700 [Thermoleophilaceae bacterium]